MRERDLCSIQHYQTPQVVLVAWAKPVQRGSETRRVSGVCMPVSICVYFCQMECLRLAATIYEGTDTHVTGELRANVILPSHNESVGSVTEQECVL